MSAHDDQYSASDLGSLFVGDDPEEPTRSKEDDSLYEAALAWARKGYNVIPQKAPHEKRPGVKWKDLQKRPVTEAELAQWRSMFANGVGFISGAISGVVVIETDGSAGETVLDQYEFEHGALPETLVIRSGSQRGFHRHFKHPGHKVKTTANPAIKVDVKGDGGFCILPPSLHKSGGRYEIVHDAEPAELPQGLLEFIEAKSRDAGGAQGNAKAREGVSHPHDGPSMLGQAPEHLSKRKLGTNTAFNGPAPPGETMRAMLEFLNAKSFFEHRDGVVKDADGRIIKLGWRETGMALKVAYGDEVGCGLWAITHRDDEARKDAPDQWESFASEARAGQVTLGTIIMAAKDAGFVFTPTVQPSSAQPASTGGESSFISHHPFTMDADDGLTKAVKVGGGGKNAHIEMAWISAPFEVLGACRDPHGRAWGKQLRFHDDDNRTHAHHVSDAALQGDPATLCAALADEGLKINRSKQREFAEYLSGVGVGARVTVVNRTGWHEIGEQVVFVLPTETIAADIGEKVVLDQRASGPYEARGSLEDWKRGVGRLTAGHVLPTFMVSAALAGPLAYVVGAEGGGVHLFGNSSIGKSAILQAAASVWGRGSTPGYVRSWRATANGLEGAAASATDTCLVLDELNVGEARDVAASVYALANGVGKSRAMRDGSLREPKGWRVFILSSGEVRVEGKIGEDHGRKTRAGQVVRLLDIPADRGLGFGAFDHAGEHGDAGKLADAIKDAAGSACGTAGPEFVRNLMIAREKESPAGAKRFMAEFVRRVAEPGSSEQIVRAAKKFALAAAAGELATFRGVTPWARDAERAASLAFHSWLDKRGGAGSHEERQAVEQVRLIIEQHESRFERADVFLSEVRDRLGWCKGEGAGREWYVPPEIWKVVFCNGLDPTFVAQTLAARGMLRRQDRGHLQCVVALSGKKQKLRAYVLTAAILDNGEG